MLSHKLVLDAFVDQPFKLIAIHCSIEDFKLAFLLNKHLGLRLSRARKDVDLHDRSDRALFSLYKFSDQQKYCDYYLVCNKFKGQTSSPANTESLFEGDDDVALRTTNLIAEYSKVDFFLKIEEEVDSFPEREFLEKLKEIPQIATAYSLNINELKSKENLIFD